MKYTTLLRAFARRNAVVVIIGQSGGGKNTLVQPLLETGLFFYSETGQLFRDNIPLFSEENKKTLKSINDSGRRQSWSIATALWVRNILMNYKKGPIIIDGSPRSRGEARALLDFFGAGYLHREIVLFHLKVSDTTAEGRMIHRNNEIKKQRGTVRKDTATQKARMKKLNFFHTDVLPAIRYLKNKGIAYYEINGELSIDAVRKQFFDKVQQYMYK